MKKIVLIISFVLFILIGLIFLNNNKYSYIVHIEGTYKDSISSGSGIVYEYYNDKYYIVTNYHIIAFADKIYIYNSNKKREATLEKYDDYKDIAVLSIDNINLKVKRLNKCIYNNGEFVKIIGSKVNKKGKIEETNVSLDVPNTYGNSIYNAFKIDYDIDYGDSGSAVIDRKGDIIGLISVMDLESKKGYAIPICELMEDVDLLMNNKINRPDLKAQFTNSKSDIEGVLILSIYDDSKLKELNIKVGYIITKVGNISVKNISEFRNELYKYSNEDIISLEYYDNEKYNEVYLKLK